MEESRAEPAPCAPGMWEEPSACADALLVLTPVPEPRVRETRPGGVHVAVTGLAVMVVTAEVGRRAGVPAGLAVACSAAGFAAVLVPRLVSVAPPGPRIRPRPRQAVAPAAY
ncbi:hypothetical protein E1200_25630 [Actinomadura sp. GC306]|uniref:hypothetical protein n=1 Tax=Actinomadura sp. GC306 TaxID=2530367 RepID=UPI0010540526|nr:hypothetical protein [Actinomadura sp. GC306]TDC62487.1 hypothetical protein E1200_25630 [Actinomadura sp. GC306]